MLFTMFSAIVSVLALAATVTGKTISISVGKGGSLRFNPNTTTANIGDTLEFRFYNGSGPHSVVRGVFEAPCMPAGEESFFSDYITGSSTGSESYIITVNTSMPIWYYCSARKHCQEGMVGVINPPSNGTVAGFAAAASSASSNIAPASTKIGGTVTTFTASQATGTSNTTGYGTLETATDAATGGHASSTARYPAAIASAGVAKQTANLMGLGLMAVGGFAALMA